MKNKFKIGELVIVKYLDKSIKKVKKALGIIEYKDYFYNQYLISLITSEKKKWFDEKNIIQIWERKLRKMFKYKVVLTIEKKGLDIIFDKLKDIEDTKNNKFNYCDISYEYQKNNKKYIILVWKSTYWSENNYSVKILNETLKELKEKNIAYQEIIVGKTDPTDIRIEEFIENDSNVDVSRVISKIKILQLGGIQI